MDVALLPAVTQLALLRDGTISPIELAEEHIARIERLNPLLNALVDFDPDRIRAQARIPVSGPLAGLPLTVKSCIELAGHRCEIGSTLLRGTVATGDAEAVARLRRDGAIFLGTTNCPEFLMAYETDNLLHGRTCNPWDLARSPGGSSGGESAAIAAGLSAGGIGSDSGGSVRQPAHATGICSLKPTPGRVPAIGHRPPCVGPFSSLGAIGPMARTIADVTLLFRSLTDHFHEVSPENAKAFTIGWLDEDDDAPVTAETSSAVRTAASELTRQGFRVIPSRPPSLARAGRLWQTFFVQCGALFYESTVSGHLDELSPIFRDFLATAHAEPPLTAPGLLQTWAETDLLRESFVSEMSDCPILLTPVSSVPAFRHGEREWSTEGQRVGYWNAMRYTQWFNLLACPAAVVPVGQSPEGLPIGVQVVGRPHEDERVLAVAAALDRAFGYRIPPHA